MKSHTSTLATALALSCGALACLQFPAQGAILTNRYSFNETSGTVAADSVGGQNATLMNTASFSGTGQAVIAPTYGQLSGDSTGPYIALPANLLTNYSAVTLEAWITPTLDDILGGAFWARVWDFGNSDGTSGVNGFIYSRVGNDSFAVLADSYTTTYGDSWCYTAAEMLSGQENHFVWTADGSNHVAHVYLNGVLVGTSTTFTNSPAIVGSTTNDWLGRSQFSGDPYINASYDEFRVYSGTLTPFEVAADYQAGPDVYPAGSGTLTNLQLTITTPIGLGNSAPCTVAASSSGLTNTINISLNPEIAIGFASANTNIAKVDAMGNVTGLSSGTVNIMASYGGLSATQAVQVIALPTTMIHRYSFNDGTANDSVGTANGLFYNTSGSSSIANGQLNLVGQGGDYVDLGPGIITATNIPNNAVTLEAWATFYPQNGAWTRLFDFGNIVGGNVGANYLFLAPNTAANGGNSRIAVSDASPGYTDEAGFNRGNLLGQTNLHVVVVFNPNPSREFLGLYLNGQFQQSIALPSRYTLATLNDQYSLLGRSLYSGSGDAWLNGSIDEFRIYNGELDKFQIAASYQAGPDHTNFNVGTFTSFTVNLGTMPMALSSFRSVSAYMNFSLATNVLVTGDPYLSLTSANPGIFTVTPAGVVTATGVGSANLVATYAYVTGGTTNFYTNTTMVTVFRDLPPTLIHRYSFNDGTANDSVGTANGTLVGSATVNNGQLVLPNATSAAPALDYLQLPAGVVTNNIAVTIEAWATVFPGQYTWANLFDFGSQDANGQAAYDIHNCIHGSGNYTVTGIADSDNANVHTEFASSQPGLDGQTNIHIVCVFDPPAGYIACYTNSVLMNYTYNTTIQMSGVQDVRNLIGADNWPDPGLQGNIDEFRIYSGVLHADEIAQTQALGPNQLLGTSGTGGGPALTVSLSAGMLTISWPSASTGFNLFSTSTLPPATWTQVTQTPQIVGNSWQVSVPASANAQYFRLSK